MSPPPNLLFRMVAGLCAGASATGPMTLGMIALHRRLSKADRHPLPPKEITLQVAKQLGLSNRLDRAQLNSLTLANHWAYGSAAGAAYALLAPTPTHSFVSKGLAWGVLVWGLSYLGLLPGFALLKPATHQSMPRNFLMIGVHLIWGLMLALVVKSLLQESRRPAGALVGLTDLPHRDAP